MVAGDALGQLHRCRRLGQIKRGGSQQKRNLAPGEAERGRGGGTWRCRAGDGELLRWDVLGGGRRGSARDDADGRLQGTPWKASAWQIKAAAGTVHTEQRESESGEAEKTSAKRMGKGAGDGLVVPAPASPV